MSGVSQIASQAAMVRSVCDRGASFDGRRRCLQLRLVSGAEKAEERRHEDDEREGQGQEEDRYEGQPGNGPMLGPLERPPGDPQQRLDDNHQHGGLDAEKDSFDNGHLPECRIDHRQNQHHRRPRQHEQQPRRQPSRQPMQAPPGICGELHGFRPRQQHAEAQPVEEMRLVQPLLLIDDDPMHQRDLRRRAAEREDAYFPPGDERLAK